MATLGLTRARPTRASLSLRATKDSDGFMPLVSEKPEWLAPANREGLEVFGREASNGEEDGQVQGELAPWSVLNQLGVEVLSKMQSEFCASAPVSGMEESPLHRSASPRNPETPRRAASLDIHTRAGAMTSQHSRRRVLVPDEQATPSCCGLQSRRRPFTPPGRASPVNI